MFTYPGPVASKRLSKWTFKIQCTVVWASRFPKTLTLLFCMVLWGAQAKSNSGKPTVPLLPVSFTWTLWSWEEAKPGGKTEDPHLIFISGICLSLHYISGVQNLIFLEGGWKVVISKFLTSQKQQKTVRIIWDNFLQYFILPLYIRMKWKDWEQLHLGL